LALQARNGSMIAALATLTFLVTLWMLAVIGAAVIEGSGEKIRLALRGHILAPRETRRMIRPRHQPYRPHSAVQISARQRAAA
jgi:hypothetical protein